MLDIGMEIAIQYADQENNSEFKAKIVDIDKENIYITYPINLVTSKTEFIPNDTELQVSFIDKDSNAYYFRTIVKGRKKKVLPMIALENPEKDQLFKIQRRQFVRVKSLLDIALEFPESNLHFATVTDDISAGGCAVLLPKSIEINKEQLGTAYIVLPMQSGENIYLKLTCKLIRIFEKKSRRLASLQFVDVQDQEKYLIRYCFEKQLEDRKKGIDSSI